MRNILVWLLLIFPIVGLAKWYAGEAHAHSTFSDGNRTPEVLMADTIIKGCHFLIPTDHHEYIPEKQKIGGLLADDFGFANYLERFKDNPTILGKSYSLTVLPCAELMFGPQHLLVMGDLAPVISELKQNSLQAQLEFNQANGLSSVAAHPSKEKYWFDRNLTVNGVEFFNESAAEYEKTRAWYLNLKDAWVISGWDTHNPATDAYDGQRRTWIYSDQPLTRASLIEALERGQTYAANWGARLSEINYVPSVTAYQIIDQGKTLRIKISFDRPVATAKKCHFYDNGRRLSELSVTMKAGAKDLVVEYRLDKPGQHAVVFEVENCLITSRINFEIEESAVSSILPTTFRGGAPILLGKTRAELEALWGKVAFGTNTWFYVGKPIKDFATEVFFYEFHNLPDGYKRVLTDRVEMVSIRKGWTPSPFKPRCFAPSDLVPQEILNLPPTEICRSASYASDAIAVIWRLRGNTYVLMVRDTRHRLYDEIKTDQGTIYRLNQYGRNFREANDAGGFVQIKGYPNFYGVKHWWENGDFQNRGSFGPVGGFFYRFDE